jgi:N-glycosylase/DNA lyase
MLLCRRIDTGLIIAIQVRWLGAIAIWFSLPRTFSLPAMSHGLRRSIRSSIQSIPKTNQIAKSSAHEAPMPFAVPSVDMTYFSPKVIRTVTPRDTPITVCPAVLTEPLTSNNNEDDTFEDLRILPSEFRPSRTFTTGQCFHWIVTSSVTSSSAWGTHDATEWIGTLRRGPKTTLVVQIREMPNTVLFRTLYMSDPALDVRSFLHSYLQLDVCLSDLYTEWSTQCPRLKFIAAALPGVRILDQDPWECLVSFICSSNNNIPRITQMLQSIRQLYGDPIHVPEYGSFYVFPSVLQMCSASEADLRKKCGMGYRAKYLVATVQRLQELGGEAYLQRLRVSCDPFWVQEQLQQFTGVGRKVADCVALFSLQQHTTIPVDVHVWNIARRDYGAATLPTKSLTPTVYRQISDLFRARFPLYSGWAHSLLFVAELPSFRSALPLQLVKEMDAVRFKKKRICVLLAELNFRIFCGTVPGTGKGHKSPKQEEIAERCRKMKRDQTLTFRFWWTIWSFRG